MLTKVINSAKFIWTFLKIHKVYWIPELSKIQYQKDATNLLFWKWPWISKLCQSLIAYLIPFLVSRRYEKKSNLYFSLDEIQILNWLMNTMLFMDVPKIAFRLPDWQKLTVHVVSPRNAEIGSLVHSTLVTQPML